MSKKKGRSEKKKDLFGRSYIQHYDADGNKRSTSRREKTIFGREYTQHYDGGGSKQGKSETKQEWFGGKYTQKYDSHGEKSGTSEEKKTWVGKGYIQHYDSKGNEGDRSEYESTWFGKKYIARYGNDKKGFSEKKDRESFEVSGSDRDSNVDYRPANRKVSEFWAITSGWVIGFLFIKEALTAAGAVITARHLTTTGKANELLAFTVLGGGILAGVTITELLRENRRKCIIAGVAAIVLVSVLDLFIAFGGSSMFPVNTTQISQFAGTHWRGHVGESLAFLDISSMSGPGTLSARIRYDRTREDLFASLRSDGVLVLQEKAHRSDSGHQVSSVAVLYGAVSPDGSYIHGFLRDAQSRVQWDVRKLTLADLPEIQKGERNNSRFDIKIKDDQTFKDMVDAGNYRWKEANWMYEVGRDPIWRNRHGTTNVRIVLVNFNRQMQSDEVISELDQMNLRPIEVAELLAFGAAYPRKQVEYPIVALGSAYHGWSPSLDNRDMPVWGMVGRGLSLGGNRNGGDLWEPNSRFGAVKK